MDNGNNSGCLTTLAAVASLIGGIAWLIYTIMIWLD